MTASSAGRRSGTGVPLAPAPPVPYPNGAKLAVIVASLAASVFLCALDETIITTAIPKITDEFGSTNDIGWYGSAYFMTFASFQLMFGKLFSFYSTKAIFLSAVAIFELGSLICATAPTSGAFIAGRACAGVGSSGINAGFIIIMAESVSLHRRPIFLTSYSAMFGVAAFAAPLLGGAFTTKASWRWCFYINLPVGAAVAGAMFFSFHPRSGAAPGPGLGSLAAPLTWRERMGEMDLPGTLLLVPGLVLLLIALQWGGGQRYAWNSGPVVSALVVAILFLLGFVVVQIRRGDKATVPPRIISQRTVACSSCYVFMAGGAQNLIEYYLPIWFQAVQGATALDSGTRILPLTLGRVLFSLAAGCGVARLGYYTPFMIAGAGLLVGAWSGLGAVLGPASPAREWVGLQAVAAAGAGLGLQQAHTGAQTVLGPRDVPTGAVVLIFAHIMGSTVWLSVGQAVFASRLLGSLGEMTAAASEKALPGLDPRGVLSLGATGFRGMVPPRYLPLVVEAYNRAVTSVFFCAVGLGAVALVASLGVEWKSVKRRAGKEEQESDSEKT